MQLFIGNQIPQEEGRRRGARPLSVVPWNWVLAISPIVLWTKQRLPIASGGNDKALIRLVGRAVQREL